LFQQIWCNKFFRSLYIYRNLRRYVRGPSTWSAPFKLNQLETKLNYFSNTWYIFENNESNMYRAIQLKISLKQIQNIFEKNESNTEHWSLNDVDRLKLYIFTRWHEITENDPKYSKLIAPQNTPVRIVIFMVTDLDHLDILPNNQRYIRTYNFASFILSCKSVALWFYNLVWP
jgi:hypothetical protein